LKILQLDFYLKIKISTILSTCVPMETIIIQKKFLNTD
jgi:hypothetical protein